MTDLISKSTLIEALQSSIYVDHKYGNWIYEDALLNLINSAPVVKSIEHDAPSAPIEAMPSENCVLVDRGALSVVIKALRRDAAQGKSIRGEMADALLPSTQAPKESEG